MKKLKVGILFGGQSTEHEVSVRSAKNVYAAIDKMKYEVRMIGISKTGQWISVLPEKVLQLETIENSFEAFQFGNLKTFDVIFPLLHGPYGEDGTVQGLLKVMKVPFVGSSVLGSAIGMDKDVMKRLLRDAGVPIAKFTASTSREALHFKEVVTALGLPFFVKPANAGSSVGVSKVHTEEEFRNAVALAFQFDTKILCEEAISGRELEVAVLGDEAPKPSVVGEIIPNGDFYSYEAKYLATDGAILKIPAEISEETQEELQKLAVSSFQILEASGLARIDFFLTRSGKILVNEINTIPGFTSGSMYPKLWEQSGVSYTALLDHLIDLALKRYKKEKQLITSYR